MSKDSEMNYKQSSVSNTTQLLVSNIIRYMTLWLYGGFIYYLIELVWRGHSHPSMFITGGIAFLCLGIINNYLPWRMGFILQCIIGGIVITVLELIVGLIVNVWLGLGIWDYSDLRFNVMGQIVPHFTFAWMALSAVAIWLDDFLRWKIFGEQKPEYRIFRWRNE